MESPSPEKENINKDVRNLFRLDKLEKQANDVAIKGIRNLFRLEKENKAIKNRILGIRNLFEHEEEENYYKPVRVYNFLSNNIEYKRNSGRNKILLVEEYLNKIRPYLRDVINNLKKSDT